MSTQESVSTIKQGDRVVYAVNGEEHNGIALGIANVGYNQALKFYSAYLSLVYLNEAAEAVKVTSAPLLSSEADEDFLNEAALAAAKKDAGWYDGGTNNDELIAMYLDRIKANPRTIGWRPDNAVRLLAESALEPQGSGTERYSEATDWTQTVGAGLTDDTSEIARSYEGRIHPAGASPTLLDAEQDRLAAARHDELELLAAQGNGLAQITVDAHPETETVPYPKELVEDFHQQVYGDGTVETVEPTSAEPAATEPSADNSAEQTA